MTHAEFHSQVMHALRGSPEEFSLSELVREAGVPDTLVNTVTRRVYSKYVARLIEDCDYTPAEQRKAASLANMLEIPPAEAKSLAAKAREALYREELLRAEADGVVTDDEEAALYQLRMQLGLPVVPLSQSRQLSATATATNAEPASVDSSTGGNQTAVAPAVSSAAIAVAGVVPFAPEALKKTGKFESTNTAQGMLFELDQLQQIDKLAEERAKKWLMVVFAAVIVFVLSFIGIMFRTADGVGPISMILLGGSAAVGIVAFVLKNSGQQDVEDSRYIVMRDLVRHLACDMGDDQLLKASVDFNDYTDSAYLTDQQGGMFTSIKTFKYSLPWVVLKGRLLDGSRFRVAATREVKVKKKSKRKYTKVTENFNEKIDLTLAVRPKTVPYLSAAAELLQRRPVVNGIQVRQVTVQDNKLVVQAVSPKLQRVQGRYGTTNKDAGNNTTSHHQLLGLFLACYDSLGRAKSRGSRTV